MFLQHLISPNLYSFNLLLLRPNVALWSQPNVHTSGPSVAGRQRATKHLHWEFGPLWDGYVRTKVSWNIQMLNYVWRHLDIPDPGFSNSLFLSFPAFPMTHSTGGTGLHRNQIGSLSWGMLHQLVGLQWYHLGHDFLHSAIKLFRLMSC